MKQPYLFRLLLVRHGEAEGNQKGVFLGRADVPLTPNGERQIRALRDRLLNESIDAIDTSPLKRATSSAWMLAGPDLPAPRMDERLIEQDYGQWDTLPFQDVTQKYADDFNAWQAGDIANAPTGGEPLSKVSERITAWFNERRETIPNGGTLLAVGHASAFQSLLCGLMKVPPRNRWPFRLQNGTLTEVVFNEAGPTLTRLSWV